MTTLFRGIFAVAVWLMVAPSQAITIGDNEPILSQSHGALLVVHPETGYDPTQSTERGIREVVQEAKQNGYDIYYIVSDKKEEQRRLYPDRADLQVLPGTSQHFLPPQEPTAYIFSQVGAHELKMQSNKVVITGGYLENCAAHAVADAIQNSKQDIFDITIPMHSVFGGAGPSKCKNLTAFDCFQQNPSLLQWILERFAGSVSDFSYKDLRPDENRVGLDPYTFYFKMDGQALPFTYGSGSKVVNVNLLYRSSVADGLRRRSLTSGKSADGSR